MTTAIHQETPQLGEGIFLAKDISEILSLPYHKVRNAMNGYWESSKFGDERNKAVNFYSLIEFYLYYHFREHGMSGQKIKKFHGQLQKDLGTRYPFAHYHIRTDYRNIWASVGENLVKADGKRQLDLLPLLDKFLHKITYGKNNLAEKYFPLGKTHKVVVDPQHQFGQPTIQGTNIQTAAIYNLYKAGETQKNISILYDVPVGHVRDAILYYKRSA